ncbi:TonB-dependent receptor [bacterium]|nr:TonB-dependent receptor [bacterium]NUN44446.1 TonB-dependent receptor [bacterium]
MKNSLLCAVVIAHFFPFLLIGQNKDSTRIYNLEGTTITSTRVPESIIEVPLAVSVIDRKEFDTKRGFGMNDAMIHIPGVLAQSRSGGTDLRISIRGFGTRGAGDRSNAGTSRGIRVLLNGLPLTEPDGRTALDLIDMNMVDRMEVVRSNASSVWGNAGGGIVDISTLPSNSGRFAVMQAKTGSFGLKEWHARTGTTIGSTQFYAGYTQNSYDGWRANSQAERRILTMGLQSSVTEQTTFTALLVGGHNQFSIPGPLTKQQYDSLPTQANPAYKTQRERRNNKILYMGLSLQHNINDENQISGMAFVNPKVLHRSERNTYRDFTRYHIGGNTMYRHNHEWGTLKTITLVGGDLAYQDGAILFYPLTNGRRDIPAKDTSKFQNKKEGARSLGYFIQHEIQFDEKWTLLTGLRYDDVTYYNQNFLDASIGKQKKSFTHWTPKAGITYRITPVHSMYANIGGGVEVPAGNETDPADTVNSYKSFNPLLKPITSVTAEIGTKKVIAKEGFLKGITYDAALFWIQVTNDVIPYRSGRFYMTAGKTQRIGLEISEKTDFAKGFSLKTSATISKNTYEKYRIDSSLINAASTGKFTDYSDNKQAGVPDFYYSVSGRWTPDFMKWIFAELTVQGIGSYYTDDANTIKVPAYTVFNASIGIGEPIRLSEHYTIRGFISVNNLMDKKYAGSTFINPDLNSVNKKPMYLEPGLPRNFAASISLAWE